MKITRKNSGDGEGLDSPDATPDPGPDLTIQHTIEVTGYRRGGWSSWHTVIRLGDTAYTRSGPTIQEAVTDMMDYLVTQVTNKALSGGA